MDTSVLQFSNAIVSKKFILKEPFPSPLFFSIQNKTSGGEEKIVNHISQQLNSFSREPSGNKLSSFPFRRIYGSVSSQNGPCLRSHFFSVKRNSFSSKIRSPKRSMETVITGSLPVSSANAHLAGALFTFGTAFVVPMYTAMIFAPNQPFTRKFVESPLPYLVLGALYLYLLSLSWTPETLSLMFASKYWLPELPGITRMFSSTLTVASAWIHLLAVDLYAARQVFLDGLQERVETRHSLVLCLMFGPIGILSHSLTKILFRPSRHIKRENDLIRTSVGI